MESTVGYHRKLSVFRLSTPCSIPLGLHCCQLPRNIMSSSRPPVLVPATAEAPADGLVNALLTDHYQLTMAYAYWKAGIHRNSAVFDMFFRKAPFNGEFAIFAGLEEGIKYVQTLRFTPEHVAYLRGVMACEEGFWEYLGALDASELKVFAVA
jgi:hypothetical protein